MRSPGVFLLAAYACAAPRQAPATRQSDAGASSTAIDPSRFETDIRAFETADSASPPPG